MPSLKRLLLSLISLSYLSNPAMAKPTTECYGETLEVQIQMYAADKKNNGQVVLSLPNPASWTMIGRVGVGSLHDAGCLDEPVLVSTVYGSGMLSKFQRALAPAPPELAQIVSLSIYGGLKIYTPEEMRLNGSNRAREWFDIPHGFRRYDSIGNELFMEFGGRKFASGLISFPDSHLTPAGLPVMSRCDSFGYCQIDYRRHERLGIKYKYCSSIYYDRLWIPQDQALRDLINSWVNDLPVIAQ